MKLLELLVRLWVAAALLAGAVLALAVVLPIYAVVKLAAPKRK